MDDRASTAPTTSLTAESPDISRLPEAFTAAFLAGDRTADTKQIERLAVDTVGRMYERLSAGDMDGFLAQFAEDVVFEVHAPEAFGFRSRAKGRGELRDLVTHNFGKVAAQTPTVHSLVAQGETVVLVMREAGVVRRTNHRYSAVLSQLFTFRGPLISEFIEVVALDSEAQQ
ncbi:MAG: nuclear transport factor 2 family protein [Vicinamibacterales bacterium]